MPTYKLSWMELHEAEVDAPDEEMAWEMAYLQRADNDNTKRKTVTVGCFEEGDERL